MCTAVGAILSATDSVCTLQVRTQVFWLLKKKIIETKWRVGFDRALLHCNRIF